MGLMRGWDSRVLCRLGDDRHLVIYGCSWDRCELTLLREGHEIMIMRGVGGFLRITKVDGTMVLLLLLATMNHI